MQTGANGRDQHLQGSRPDSRFKLVRKGVWKEALVAVLCCSCHLDRKKPGLVAAAHRMWAFDRCGEEMEFGNVSSGRAGIAR